MVASRYGWDHVQVLIILSMHKDIILLTGASGYIGGRLLRALEEGGRTVRCLARNPEKVAVARATTTVVQGDCLDEASIYRALAGVDTAYYLVHSMAAGPGFEGLDQRAALNFRIGGGARGRPPHHLPGWPW